MKKRVLAAVVFSLAIAAAVPAGAAVQRLLYLDDMIVDSGVIVHATVVQARPEWNAGRTSINTVYTARALQYLKGFLGQTFTFYEPGGKIGNLVQEVSGAPEFRENEEVVLFLWTDGRSGRYQCIGFQQGALRVSEVNGGKVVDHSIPVRGEDTKAGPARAAQGPRLGTSRDLRTVLGEIVVNRYQLEAAAAAKEAR